MEYKVEKVWKLPAGSVFSFPGDYWVVYSASVAAIGLCVLAAAQGLTEGHWEFFWSMLGICSVAEPLLCYMFWRKTLSRKFKNRNREITLSNLEMTVPFTVSGKDTERSSYDNKLHIRTFGHHGRRGHAGTVRQPDRFLPSYRTGML